MLHCDKVGLYIFPNYISPHLEVTKVFCGEKVARTYASAIVIKHSNGGLGWGIYVLNSHLILCGNFWGDFVHSLVAYISVSALLRAAIDCCLDTWWIGLVL